MDTIELSPAVLDWAASQAGEDVGELAQKISKKSASKIAQGQLTYPQVLKYAKLAGVPLGYLFLEKPPQTRALPFADFRTLRDADPLGKDFFDLFDDIEFKHSWLKERRRAEEADSLPFVGRYHKIKPKKADLAAEIAATLGFNQEIRKQLRTPEQLFSTLVELCEGTGIYVFKNGVVGNNTRRPLSVSEFRGFAVADQFCPIIFINGADAPAAWLFTLAHELAHIWLGDSGISDVSPHTESATEQYCNAVAGEFLVPEIDFKAEWTSLNEQTVEYRIDELRRIFKVSSTVIARRAFDLGLVPKEVYFAVYNLARKVAKERTSGGGDFHKTLAIRNSKRFSTEVVNLAISGAITLGQAGRLLNTNPNNVVKLHEKRNAISI